MSVQRVFPVLLLVCVCCLTSCGQSTPTSKVKKVKVVPVKGTVTVDGKPEAGVTVTFIPTLGSFEPKEHAKGLVRKTNEKGEYAMGTYEIADGLPPGDYALTFVWEPLELNIGNGPGTRPSDKLDGKYNSVDNSPKSVKVENSPVVVETIDLKTGK